MPLDNPNRYETMHFYQITARKLSCIEIDTNQKLKTRQSKATVESTDQDTNKDNTYHIKQNKDKIRINIHSSSLYFLCFSTKTKYTLSKQTVLASTTPKDGSSAHH